MVVSWSSSVEVVYAKWTIPSIYICIGCTRSCESLVLRPALQPVRNRFLIHWRPIKFMKSNQLMFFCVHTSHAWPCCQCCLLLIDCWHWLIIIRTQIEKKIYGFDHESTEWMEIFVSNQISNHALMRETTPRKNWFEEESSRFVQLASKVRKSSLTLT